MYDCSNAVEKKTVLENLDLVLLAMDEIVDGGWVGIWWEGRAAGHGRSILDGGRGPAC